MHTLQFERYFTPCSHGPFVGGALFRFVPFLVESSLDVSVFSASPTSGTSILTRGRQTVVIPILEVGAPLEVRFLRGHPPEEGLGKISIAHLEPHRHAHSVANSFLASTRSRPWRR